MILLNDILNRIKSIFVFYFVKFIFFLFSDPEVTATASNTGHSSPSVVAINCSASEKQLVQQCAAPLSEIHSRLSTLFEGGFQGFLKNLHSLSDIFAKGSSSTQIVIIKAREFPPPVLIRLVLFTGFIWQFFYDLILCPQTS